MMAVIEEFIEKCYALIEKHRASSVDSWLVDLRKAMNDEALNVERKIASFGWSAEDLFYVRRQMVIAIDVLLSAEIGNELQAGTRNFAFYVAELQKKCDVRWHIENYGDKGSTLCLESNGSLWVCEAKLGKPFAGEDDARKFITNLKNATGADIKSIFVSGG